MVVYLEYAFAENFLLDGLLLYLALKCAKGRISVWRLVLSSAIGGAEAIIFPLLTLPNWCAYLLKLLGGILLAVIVVSRGPGKIYFVTVAAFFVMTFLLGGLLTAIYSFFEIPYLEGQGYYLESAPVVLVLTVSGIFAILAVQGVRLFYRYRKVKQNIFPCQITSGKRTVVWQGFADSGNCLSFRGEPVCVISPIGALALFKEVTPVGRMTVSTVNGSRDSPVFACDRLEVGGTAFENCYFTVGGMETKEYQLILHTAFLEGAHERTHRIKSMAEEIRGK